MAMNYERIEVANRGELRAWLAANYDRKEGIWLVFGKKVAGQRYVPYEDIVEEALCFGWIDGRAQPMDGERRMLLLSPRRAGSVWSKINKERVERLVAAGLMTGAGLRKIEAAKRDGSWTRLDDMLADLMPNDLAIALDRYEGARANFDAFPPSSKKIVVGWINTAKRPETRARRVEEAAENASRNIRANHPQQRA
jgi:uncharacterized protein YdeI (YjbR/CyaY-like superfamily)